MNRFNLSKSIHATVLFMALVASSLPGQAGEPLKTGDAAPDFQLATLDGRSVSLANERATRPVVLVVLRGWPGYQCPVCTQQVGDFIRHASELTGKARVIMVYPGPADELKAHADEFLKNKIWPEEFRFVLDPDYTFTKAYGLRWDAPKETAYPATFVIDTAGKIRFVKISRGHGGRASADEILKALETVK